MATIGLRDLYMALVTEDQDGKETYGKPKRIAKAISADMSVDVAEAYLYADDAAADVSREFVKGTLKLNVDDITPIVAAELLGQKTKDGDVFFSGENDLPPYFAIGFRAKRNNGTYKYIWLYKVKFSVPSEKYQTKGDKLEFTTPEIEGVFVKRNDGLWKADHVGSPEETEAKNWFNAVRLPAEPTEP